MLKLDCKPVRHLQINAKVFQAGLDKGLSEMILHDKA